MEELYPYNGNLPWLKERTILLVTHGSHAYGLNTEASDIDIKGVAVPPEQYFLGFASSFEQAESRNPDLVVYDIRKFCRLAADCNPSIIEVLWADESDFRVVSKAGMMLVAARHLFLSKRARHTFSGYAVSQLKRIQAHYRWLKNPPKAPPTRSEFGLPERTVIPADQLMAAQSAIEKKMETWGLDDMSGLDPATRIAIKNGLAETMAEMKISSEDQYAGAARTLGYTDNFIRILDLERRYKTSKTEWNNYNTWKEKRNPKRAEIEIKYGYDCKHAMHLVRLLRMCREILTLGKVIVKRPDREELLAIRNGAWTYEQVVEWASKEDAEMQDLYKASTLKHAPDPDILDKLCMTIVEETFESTR